MPLFIRCRVDLAIAGKNAPVTRRQTEYRYKIDFTSVYLMEGAGDRWSQPERKDLSVRLLGDTEIELSKTDNTTDPTSIEKILIDRTTGSMSGVWKVSFQGQLFIDSEMHGQCQKDEPWSISRQF